MILHDNGTANTSSKQIERTGQELTLSMMAFPFPLQYSYRPLRWRFNTLEWCEVSKVVSSAGYSSQISQNLTAAKGVHFLDLSSGLQPSYPRCKICV